MRRSLRLVRWQLAFALFAMALPTNAGQVVQDINAASRASRECAVEGLFANVYTSDKGGAFLNFERPYPHQTSSAGIFSKSGTMTWPSI